MATKGWPSNKVTIECTRLKILFSSKLGNQVGESVTTPYSSSAPSACSTSTTVCLRPVGEAQAKAPNREVLWPVAPGRRDQAHHLQPKGNLYLEWWPTHRDGKVWRRKVGAILFFTPNLSPNSSSSLRGVRGSGTSSTLREGLHISKGEPLGSKNGARTLEEY